MLLPSPTIRFPLLQPISDLRDVKDPCPVFDGRRWHLFGSAGSTKSETWLIFHATADSPEGPWQEQKTIRLELQGSGVAAPGVLHEDGRFVMFIQTEFMREGGTIEYLTSEDGVDWTHRHTALHSIAGSAEHGIYDPHPALIGGERYLVYSGMPQGFPPKPDIYLAKSVTNDWDGPWLRMGKILDHADIEAHHNQPDQHDYEWGIEGAQLVELPNGKVLLNATCFLPGGCRGSRQRVFFAIGEGVAGPFRSLGPLMSPDEAGENGHSTAFVAGEQLLLCYQARLASTGHTWRYGIATWPVEVLLGVGRTEALVAAE